MASEGIHEMEVTEDTIRTVRFYLPFNRWLTQRYKERARGDRSPGEKQRGTNDPGQDECAQDDAEEGIPAAFPVSGVDA